MPMTLYLSSVIQKQYALYGPVFEPLARAARLVSGGSVQPDVAECAEALLDALRRAHAEQQERLDPRLFDLVHEIKDLARGDGYRTSARALVQDLQAAATAHATQDHQAAYAATLLEEIKELLNDNRRLSLSRLLAEALACFSSPEPASKDAATLPAWVRPAIEGMQALLAGDQQPALRLLAGEMLPDIIQSLQKQAQEQEAAARAAIAAPPVQATFRRARSGADALLNQYAQQILDAWLASLEQEGAILTSLCTELGELDQSPMASPLSPNHLCSALGAARDHLQTAIESTGVWVLALHQHEEVPDPWTVFLLLMHKMCRDVWHQAMEETAGPGPLQEFLRAIAQRVALSQRVVRELERALTYLQQVRQGKTEPLLRSLCSWLLARCSETPLVNVETAVVGTGAAVYERTVQIVAQAAERRRQWEQDVWEQQGVLHRVLLLREVLEGETEHRLCHLATTLTDAVSGWHEHEQPASDWIAHAECLHELIHRVPVRRLLHLLHNLRSLSVPALLQEPLQALEELLTGTILPTVQRHLERAQAALEAAPTSQLWPASRRQVMAQVLRLVRQLSTGVAPEGALAQAVDTGLLTSELLLPDALREELLSWRSLLVSGAPEQTVTEAATMLGKWLLHLAQDPAQHAQEQHSLWGTLLLATPTPPAQEAEEEQEQEPYQQSVLQRVLAWATERLRVWILDNGSVEDPHRVLRHVERQWIELPLLPLEQEEEQQELERLWPWLRGLGIPVQAALHSGDLQPLLAVLRQMDVLDADLKQQRDALLSLLEEAVQRGESLLCA